MADIEISRNCRSSSSMSLEKKKQGTDDNQEFLSTNVRNILLVVVTLVVSVTFSAGINPPGGVWQEPTTINGRNYSAGEAIYASKPVPYAMFVIANTLAFSTSVSVISILVYVYPFKVEIWIAMFTMSFAYFSAIAAVSPDNIYLRYLIPAFTAPILIVTLLIGFEERRGRGPVEK